MSEGVRHPVLRFLVYGHVWLALGAMAQVAWVGRFTDAVDLRVAVAVGAAVIAAYGTMRLVRASEPATIASPWIHWVLEHRKLLMGMVIGAAALALWAVMGLKRVFAPYDLLVLPAAVLYLIPLHDRHGRSRGLRQVPLLKAPLIAFVWAIVTTGLSSDVVFDTEGSTAVGLAVVQFCYFLSIAMASDAIDLRHDAPGLRTAPQLLGLTAARVLCVLLLLPMLALLLVMAGWSSDLGNSSMGAGLDPTYVLPMFGLLFTAVVVARSGPDRPVWYGTVLLDGQLLVIPLLAWIGDLF